MSSDLTWEVLKYSNKFVQKRNGIRLSKDPFNNSGKYTKRHSGFAAEKAAVVKTKGEKALSVTLKTGENATQPRKMFVKKVVANAKEARKAAGAVRPDLCDAVTRKARRMTKTITRIAAVRKARKELSAGKKFKRTNTQKKAKK